MSYDTSQDAMNEVVKELSFKYKEKLNDIGENYQDLLRLDGNAVKYYGGTYGSQGTVIMTFDKTGNNFYHGSLYNYRELEKWLINNRCDPVSWEDSFDGQSYDGK